MEQEQTKTLTAKAMNYCSRKETCTAALRAKLIEWECPTNLLDTIIADLQSQRFVDDRRFAAAFVNDKLRFSHWGRNKIRYMLRMTGIAAKTADEALAEIDEGQYLEILFNILTKKLNSMHCTTIAERKAKLYRFAASRGFETDAITSVLAKIHP